MPSEATKPIKITETADRAIEAYLGWQRGIGENISKQDVLEKAVIHFVYTKMPSALLKIFNLPKPAEIDAELAKNSNS